MASIPGRSEARGQRINLKLESRHRRHPHIRTKSLRCRCLHPDVSEQTGLFSATVSSFIVQTYGTLQPDSQAATVVLLAQISLQLSVITTAINNGTSGTTIPSPSIPTTAFRPAVSIVRVQILWSISLVMSLTCALAAFLIHQWTHRYLHFPHLRLSPIERARTRTDLHSGIKQSKMSEVVAAIPFLLDASVFLFFAGLADFFFQFSTPVAYAVLCPAVLALSVYLTISLLPLAFRNCPYRTPLTTPLTQLSASIVAFYRSEDSRDPGIREQDIRPRDRTSQKSANLDQWALQWILQGSDSQSRLESFLEALPGFLMTEKPEVALEPLLKQQDAGLFDHLYKLLDSRTADLAEDVADRRLKICAKAAVRLVEPRFGRLLRPDQLNRLRRSLTLDHEYRRHFAWYFSRNHTRSTTPQSPIHTLFGTHEDRTFLHATLPCIEVDAVDEEYLNRVWRYYGGMMAGRDNTSFDDLVNRMTRGSESLRAELRNHAELRSNGRVAIIISFITSVALPYIQKDESTDEGHEANIQCVAHIIQNSTPRPTKSLRSEFHEMLQVTLRSWRWQPLDADGLSGG